MRNVRLEELGDQIDADAGSGGDVRTRGEGEEQPASHITPTQEHAKSRAQNRDARQWKPIGLHRDEPTHAAWQQQPVDSHQTTSVQSLAIPQQPKPGNVVLAAR